MKLNVMEGVMNCKNLTNNRVDCLFQILIVGMDIQTRILVSALLHTLCVLKSPIKFYLQFLNEMYPIGKERTLARINFDRISQYGRLVAEQVELL